MKSDRRKPSRPPYLIVEPEYWRCPVHVFTGATWFILGLLAGAAACALM